MADALPETVVRGDGQVVNVADLMAKAQAYANQVDASQADLNAALATARGAAGAASGGARLEAEGQIAVNNEQMRALIQKRSDDASAAARVGMTPGAPADFVIATTQNFIANQRDLLERGKMISGKQNQEFFDDPLQWLTNQFSLPFDIAAYNAKVSEQDRDLQFMHGLSQIFEEQARVNATVDVAGSESMLAGMNKIALGKAQAAAAGSQMALAQLGLSVINTRAAMTDKVFGNSLQLMNVIGAEQDRVQAARRLALAERGEIRADAQLAMERERLDMTSADFTRKEAGRSAIQARLDKATEMLGISPISVEEFQLDPNVQKRLAPFMLSTAVQMGTFGTGPGEAIDMVQGIPLAPGNEITRRWAEGKANALISGSGGTWRSLGADAQTAKKNEYLELQAKQEKNNIPISGGLYSLPTLAGVIKMESLRDDKDKTKFRYSLLDDLAPLAAANPSLANEPQFYLAAAMRRVQEGKATADEMAQQLAGIFKIASLDNNLLRGYDKFNFKVLGADNGGFRQQVNLTGELGGSVVIDMMNVAAWRNALTRSLVKRSPGGGDIIGGIQRRLGGQ